MSLTLCFHGPLKGCACAQTGMHTHVRSGRPQVCTPESPDLIEAYSFGNETVTRETRKAAESNWNWPPVRVHECVCLCSLFLGVFNVSAKAGKKFSQKPYAKARRGRRKRTPKIWAPLHIISHVEFFFSFFLTYFSVSFWSESQCSVHLLCFISFFTSTSSFPAFLTAVLSSLCWVFFFSSSLLAGVLLDMLHRHRSVKYMPLWPQFHWQVSYY